MTHEGNGEVSSDDSVIAYCSCAWYGFCTAKERDRLESFLRRCKRRGYCADNTPTVDPRPPSHQLNPALPSPTTWDRMLTIWHYQT